MHVEFVNFPRRSDRYAYLVKEFGQFLGGHVLDVGCDKAVLKQMLPGAAYTGIDIAGSPDIRLDLERIDSVPFDNDAFDCVVCLDVLEHLDNLHHVFRELVRVAKRYVIVSLPNNWVNARRPIEKGKGSFGHYGLPVHPVQDRHKWFFSLSEAVDFAKGQERNYPVSMIQTIVSEKPRPLWLRALRRLRHFSQQRYLASNRLKLVCGVYGRSKGMRAKLAFSLLLLEYTISSD